LQGHKLEILATFVTSHRHVRCIGREDREIRTAADLRNKKIAVFLGTTMEYGMMKFLQETGVTLSEIEVANVRPPDIVVALLRGDVDAAFNWEPFLSEMKLGLGGQAFVCPPSETYRATFSLLARPGFAATHPEEVRKILRTLRVAIDQISDNRDDTVNLVAEELNLERETVDGFLDDYRYGLSLDEALLRLLEEEALWVIEANGALLQEVPDFEPLFNVAPLKAVQPDAVTMTQAER
jgi:NitT/TauT family transport system substrate-binding protein